MGVLDSLRQNILPLFSEVTRVARYVVLPDSVGGVTAPSEAPAVIGSEWAPHFDAPGIVPGVHAAIYFNTEAKAEGARFSVRLTRAGDHFMMHTLTDTEPHSWHQIIPPNLLTSSDNELIFNAYDGATITFSDVVIMYTSERLTIPQRFVFR